jgi:hypothetical protein
MGRSRIRVAFPDNLGHSCRNRFERRGSLPLGFQVKVFMPRKSPTKPKLTDAERHKRFLDMAREVGASGDQKDFEKVFKTVVLSPRSPSVRYPGSRSEIASDRKSEKR